MGNTPGRWIDAHVTPRLAPAAWLIIIIPIGLICREVFSRQIGEHLGNVAWGVMWVAMVWLIAPRWTLAKTAFAALLIVWGIELLQLTPIPAALVSVWRPSRWVVGSTFFVHDLIGNALGVLLGAILVRRLAGKR